MLAEKPAPGYARNPLRDLPRNLQCPCGSGQKFKRCCLPYTKRFIPEEHLKEYQETYERAVRGEIAW